MPPTDTSAGMNSGLGVGPTLGSHEVRNTRTLTSHVLQPRQRLVNTTATDRAAGVVGVSSPETYFHPMCIVHCALRVGVCAQILLYSLCGFVGSSRRDLRENKDACDRVYSYLHFFNALAWLTHCPCSPLPERKEDSSFAPILSSP